MKCPYCVEEIPDASVLCKHCGGQIEADESTNGSSSAGEEDGIF